MEGYFGIILFSKNMQDILDKLIKKKGKLLNYVKSIISVSVSVQIIIMPITLYNYHTISLTFFISNILTSFLISIIIILGFIIVILSFFIFKIAKIIGIAYGLFIKLLLLITEFSSKIPFSKIYIKTPYIFEIIFYYIIIFLLFFKTQKIIKYRKQIIAIFLIIILITNLIEHFPNNNLKIYFIDVGQGDSTLIVTPKNKKILIDGGGSETYDIRKECITSISFK